MSTPPKVEYQAIRGEVMPRHEWEREYAELVRAWEVFESRLNRATVAEVEQRQTRMRGQRRARRRAA